MAGFIQEFREFALRGNVIDLAVGVIIGGAFGKIVDSMVNDIINPVLGLIIGKVDFSNKFISLVGSDATTLADARKAGPTLAYGAFLTTIMNFLIMAFVIFLMVKTINRLRREQPATPPTPPPPTREEELLSEIRDLLKQRAG